jgi:uncharacterized membrane protein (Fun14 family)
LERFRNLDDDVDVSNDTARSIKVALDGLQPESTAGLIRGVIADIIPSALRVVIRVESILIVPILIVGSRGRGVVAVGLTSITEPLESEHNVTLILGDGVVVDSHLDSVTERLKRKWSESGVLSEVEERSKREASTRDTEADLRLDHHTTGQHSRLGGSLDVECDTAVTLGDGVIHGWGDILRTLDDGILDGVGCGEDIV